MRIKWKGDTWQIKYYATGYARWTLENGSTSVSWLVNQETGENDFGNKKEFVKFLREKGKENVIHE